MTVKEKILDSLRHGPLNDAEIAASISAPVPSVRRCRGELLVAKEVEAYIPHADGSMTWCLPQWKPAASVKISKSALTSTFDIKSPPPEVRPAPGNIVHL